MPLFMPRDAIDDIAIYDAIYCLFIYHLRRHYAIIIICFHMPFIYAMPWHRHIYRLRWVDERMQAHLCHDISIFFMILHERDDMHKEMPWWDDWLLLPLTFCLSSDIIRPRCRCWCHYYYWWYYAIIIYYYYHIIMLMIYAMLSVMINYYLSCRHYFYMLLPPLMLTSLRCRLRDAIWRLRFWLIDVIYHWCHACFHITIFHHLRPRFITFTFHFNISRQYWFSRSISTFVAGFHLRLFHIDIFHHIVDCWCLRFIIVWWRHINALIHLFYVLMAIIYAIFYFTPRYAIFTFYYDGLFDERYERGERWRERDDMTRCDKEMPWVYAYIDMTLWCARCRYFHRRYLSLLIAIESSRHHH